MSMDVDLTKPLTAAERSYLNMRGRLADIERADALTNGSPPEGYDDSGDGTGPQMEPVLQGQVAAARKERLLAELRAIELAEASEEDATATDEPDEAEPYSAWTVPQLDKELKARQLSVTGTKPEKVARLEKDDEDAAETES
jgi:hypothetical protein